MRGGAPRSQPVAPPTATGAQAEPHRKLCSCACQALLPVHPSSRSPSEATGSARSVLEETRRQCQEEFVQALRALEWAQCWLLSPWRQQAAFVLSVATCQLVAAVSQQRGHLLSFVPEFYVTAPLDMVRAWASLSPQAPPAPAWVACWQDATPAAHLINAPCLALQRPLPTAPGRAGACRAPLRAASAGPRRHAGAGPAPRHLLCRLTPGGHTGGLRGQGAGREWQGQDNTDQERRNVYISGAREMPAPPP